MNKKHFALVTILKISIVLFLLALIIIFTVDKEKAETEQIIRNETLKQLSPIRSRIENILFSRVLLVRGVISYIETNPDLSSEQYLNFCSKQLSGDTYIRNLSLIKGSVIKYVYPAENNKKAIGTNLLMVSDQKITYLKAMETGKTVISGPLQLVQGGTGLIFRVPIFIHEKYWGQTSIVIDINSVYNEVFTENILKKYDFAIQGKDGLGENGDPVYSSGQIFNGIPVSMPITLPGGNWILYALPKKGLKIKSDTYYLILATGITLSAIIIILLIYSSITSSRLKEIAFLDFLTDTPNRRLVKLHFDMASSGAKRYNTMFAVIVIDLNDFKLINDTLGHDAGDFYLVQFSQLLKNTIRKNDFIFRIGGDEFLLFITGLNDRKNITEIVKNIKLNCSKEIQFRNKNIKFSFSMGHSIFPHDSVNLDTLMVIADRQMYAEKKRFHMKKEKTGH
ncbi:MAG: sensor domain-containing diguanylate cyclase [Spirochaetes bacterium]|nr:sensor domain-containing diguanylate cyclase [Spirochaetota bacterium]